MMKLNKEAGVNPLASCLPALIQAPVFIGLFHVLRMFQPVNDGPEGPGVWFYRQNVYFFGHEDVVSMGNAQLPGGAPLVGYMTMPQDQLAFMDGVREAIIWWGVPLTILAGIATHLTSRRSVARQREMNIDAVQPADRDHEQADAVHVPAVRGRRRPVLPARDPVLLAGQQLAGPSASCGWRTDSRTSAALAAAQVVEEAKEAAKFSTPKPGAQAEGFEPAGGAAVEGRIGTADAGRRHGRRHRGWCRGGRRHEGGRRAQGGRVGGRRQAPAGRQRATPAGGNGQTGEARAGAQTGTRRATATRPRPAAQEEETIRATLTRSAPRPPERSRAPPAD